MFEWFSDRRFRDKKEPTSWVVATDKFLSSWNFVEKSYIAYPVYSTEDANRLLAYCDKREDFIRSRHNMHLPRHGNGVHLSLHDRPWDDECGAD